MPTILGYLLVSIQLLPVLAAFYYQIQRSLEVELKLLDENRTQVACLHCLASVLDLYLLRLLILHLFLVVLRDPVVVKILYAPQTELHVLIFGEIVLAHAMLVEVADLFFHICYKLLHANDVVLILLDDLRLHV